MTRRVALLVPERFGLPGVTEGQQTFNSFQSAGAGVGILFQPVPWSQADREPAGLPIVAAMCWGYHLSIQRWRSLLDSLETRVCINSRSVLQWNTDKSYLLALAAAGVPTIPSVLSEEVSQRDLEGSHSFVDATHIVLKPRIAAGGSGIRVLEKHAWRRAKKARGMLIQPYFPSIREQGEISLMFTSFGFSHAVLKRPRTGEFRACINLGASVSATHPSAEVLEVASAALACVADGWVYARVDIVMLNPCLPVVVEVELIEPQLFLEYAPDRGRMILQSIAKAIHQHPSPASESNARK